MKILSTKLENYRSHQETFCDFSNKSIIGIVGKNGHGKSSLIESFLYGLYGQFRDKSEDQLIRDGQDTMSVTLVIEHNGQVAEIQRFKERGKTSRLAFKIDGVDQKINTLRAGNAVIEKFIGINYETFIAVTFFRQGEGDEFARSSPAIRREYMRSLIENENLKKVVDDISEQAKTVRKRIDEKNIEIRVLSSNLSMISLPFSIDGFNDAIKTVESLNADKISKEKYLKLKTEQLREIESNSQECENAKRMLNQVIFRKSEKIRDITSDATQKNSIRLRIKSYCDEFTAWENLFKPYADVDAVEIDKKEITKRIVDVSALINSHRSILKKFNTLGSICSQCEQSIDDSYKDETLRKVNSEIDEQSKILQLCKDELEKIEQNNKIVESKKYILSRKPDEKDYLLNVEWEKQLSLKIEQKKNELNEIEKSIEKLRSDLLKYEEDPTLKQEVASNIKDASNEIMMIERSISDYNFKIEAYKRNSVIADGLKSKISSVQEDLYSDMKKLKYYEDAIEIFKVKIPGMIIENLVGMITNFSNEILLKFSSGFELKITTLKEKISGEQVDTIDLIINSIDGKERNYESLSGAQKSLVNFSLRLALALSLALRQNIQIKSIVLDEVFSDFDQENLSVMVDVICALKDKFEQVFMVTHIDEIKNLFPDTINVCAFDGISRIE